MINPIKLLLLSSYLLLVNKKYSQGNAITYALIVASFNSMIIIPSLIAIFLVYADQHSFLMKNLEQGTNIALMTYFASMVFLYFSFFTKDRLEKLLKEGENSLLVSEYPLLVVLSSFLTTLITLIFCVVTTFSTE